MEYSISIYFLIFLIYSIMGWILEVTCKSIEEKRFVNRGFLIGPYCPIYGCGALLITIFLENYKDNAIILFFITTVICGILEYVTSYIMEKLFHARWWDYSRMKYNINGRVCLETLVPFGLLGLFIMYVSNPFILEIIIKIPENILNLITAILATIFVIDIFISLKVVSNVRSTATKLNRESGKDNTEEITAKVREILRGKSVFTRRLIDAYPNLQAKIKQKKEEIKQKTEEVKREVKKKIEEQKQQYKK